MDNKRIETGYDVELQLQPDIIKRSIIDSILKDVLCTNEIVKKYELSLDVAKGTFDSDGLNPVFKYPFTRNKRSVMYVTNNLIL